MPVIENATVTAFGDPVTGYIIRANNGYAIYDNTLTEEERTYHKLFSVPLSFDLSRLVVVAIDTLPEDAYIFGGENKPETEEA